MAFYCGNATLSPTGNNVLVGFGFRPVGAIITCGQKGTTGSPNTTVNYSEGTCDGTRQSVRSIYSDSTGHQTVKYNTKCVSHWERVSGTLTEKVAASFVSFDADGMTLNASVVDTNYQINIKAWS